MNFAHSKYMNPFDSCFRFPVLTCNFTAFFLNEIHFLLAAKRTFNDYKEIRLNRNVSARSVEIVNFFETPYVFLLFQFRLWPDVTIHIAHRRLSRKIDR